MITNLDSLKRYIDKNSLKHSDFVSMMAIVRIELEKCHSSNKYPMLKLICNWLLHDKISRSPIAIDLMQNFANAIITYDYANNSLADFNSHIIKSFTSDIDNFLLDNKIISNSLSDNSKRAIFFYVINTIKNRCLVLPIKKHLDSKYHIKYDKLVDCCRILCENNNAVPTIFKIESDESNILWWNLETSINLNYSIQIAYRGRGFLAR